MLASLTPDQLAPDQPIRHLKPIVDAALGDLGPVFDAIYAEGGRPSILPEHPLKASLLMAICSIRSDRQVCERLMYELPFKWFLDLNVQDPAFDQSSFAKNRERLLDHQVSRAFFSAVLEQARQRRLCRGGR
jgi:transposase